MKSYNEGSNIEYFLEIDVQYPEEFHNFTMIYHFFPERMKTQKVEELVDNLHVKKELCYAHKKFETSIKSWICIEKSAKSH